MPVIYFIFCLFVHVLSCKEGVLQNICQDNLFHSTWYHILPGQPMLEQSSSEWSTVQRSHQSLSCEINILGYVDFLSVISQSIYSWNCHLFLPQSSFICSRIISTVIQWCIMRFTLVQWICHWKIIYFVKIIVSIASSDCWGLFHTHRNKTRLCSYISDSNSKLAFEMGYVNKPEKKSVCSSQKSTEKQKLY